MHILIFKTDIDSKWKLNCVSKFFKNHQHIFRWSLDMEDVDNVLRIEASDEIIESDVIHLLHNIGIHSQDLAY